MITKFTSLLLLLTICGVRAQQDQEENISVEYLSGSTVKIAQLVGDYDREQQAPTSNLTESRYGLSSTDLGVPFRHNGRIYILFGDSFGSPGGDAIAHTTDANPEDGIDLTFITDSTGTYKPVNIPGISQDGFEVPMEGISVGGKMYIYHTTDHTDTVVMGRSVAAVSEDDGQTFSYLYDLSRKHFINVSIVEVDLAVWPGFPLSTGDGLVLFGSGSYRQSDVRLAFQPADQIETVQSLRYYIGLDEAGIPMWSADEDDAAPLFSQPCVGELSVSFNPFLRKWLMLYNCDSPRGINFRTADAPWGPWSEPRVLFDPWLDNGYCHFIHVNWEFQQCDSVHDPGKENTWGGEYGSYQFEELAIGNDSTTTIYFTMSTWNPYTVVLMKSTLYLLALPTFAEDGNPKLPARFQLLQNYPNPFNPSTAIDFVIPKSGHVTLNVFNLLGQEVAALINEVMEEDPHRVNFDAANLPSGIYFYQLRTDNFNRIKKMTLLR
jgi:hypothetical protein